MPGLRFGSELNASVQVGGNSAKNLLIHFKILKKNLQNWQYCPPNPSRQTHLKKELFAGLTHNSAFSHKLFSWGMQVRASRDSGKINEVDWENFVNLLFKNC